MSNILNVRWLQTLTANLSDRKGFLLSFVLGFVVRSIPEILSYPHPIGFDTIYYAARIKSGVVWHHWTSMFSTWLLYAILTPLNSIVQNPFLLLKLVAPVIFALNSCGIYYFATSALRWNPRKALAASFLFAFSMASLGLSWHFHRNMLGLAVLLFTLPLIIKIGTKRGFLWFILFSVLVVLSHEYASVILFSVVLALLVVLFLKGERKKSLRLLAAVSPASFIFLMSVYLMLFPVPFNLQTNVVYAEDSVYPHPAGLFFMVDYSKVDLPFMCYPSYLDLFLHVTSLFSVLYLAWVPLVLVGFFRNRILDCWTILLLVGSFDALITPFFAIDLWYRWMLMLVYPFVFYAVNGIEKVLKSQSGIVVSNVKWLRWMKVSKRGVFRILLLTISLGLIFATTPLIFDRFGVFSIPTTYWYIPSTMLYNSIPLRDVDGVVNALEWLNGQMNDHSAVLLHQALVSWADLYLDKKYVIVYYQMDIEKALEVALRHGFAPIYTIWWNQNIGWYGITVPEHFKYIFSSDRISVLQYSTD
jgi:hypothetical protein